MQCVRNEHEFDYIFLTKNGYIKLTNDVSVFKLLCFLYPVCILSHDLISITYYKSLSISVKQYSIFPINFKFKYDA